MRDLGALPDRPSVTILTPTMNRAQPLARTLASVRAQTYSNVEHIVLDGGSNDGTRELSAAAEKQWGLQWSSGRDGGMYHALNMGLELASGDVVGWINDDDWLLPWTVTTVIEVMRAEPTQCAVYGDIFSLDGLDATHAAASVSGRFRRQTLAAVGTLAQPTVFWPTAATGAVGALAADIYDEIADCEYWLRLSAEIPFVKARDFLAVVANHDATKRSLLPEKLRHEWASIGSTYTPAGVSPWIERLRYEAAWRRELLAGVTRGGWQHTRGCPLVRLGSMSPVRGDWSVVRRHPPNAKVADLSRYVQFLDALAGELAR
jgi:glycosyltransferase involved in cell wall biosynthesis